MTLIYGAGGHGRVVRDALEAAGHPVVGFLDDGGATVVDGVPVVGGRGWLAGARGRSIALGIGANRVRRLIGEAILEAGAELRTVVHPRSWVSPRAEIGAGAVIFAGAVVNCGARIGVGAIVNSGAVVEHDCALGAWSHVSPNGTLGGQARIGECAWVGLGAVVLPGIELGDGVTLGAGGVAVRSVSAGEVWAGVPARPLARRA